MKRPKILILMNGLGEAAFHAGICSGIGLVINCLIFRNPFGMSLTQITDGFLQIAYVTLAGSVVYAISILALKQKAPSKPNKSRKG